MLVPLSDPRVAAVPVRECGEPLVDLRDTGAIRLDTRRGAFPHVRLSVADRLVTAQCELPRDLRLLVVEGFRPRSSHDSGGAVDLTLCTVDGAEAHADRNTLVDAMTVAGFVNDPNEWWHWSYGDRYWAFVTGAGHARYGTAALP